MRSDQSPKKSEDKNNETIINSQTNYNIITVLELYKMYLCNIVLIQNAFVFGFVMISKIQNIDSIEMTDDAISKDLFGHSLHQFVVDDIGEEFISDMTSWLQQSTPDHITSITENEEKRLAAMEIELKRFTELIQEKEREIQELRQMLNLGK